MLRDQDRIFTNLYGLGEPGLRGAMARGDWDGTKDLVGKGRRRVRHRYELVLYAEGGR